MHCLLGQRIVSLIRSQCSSPSIVGVQAVLVSICALHKSCETFYCFLVWGKLQKPMCKLRFLFQIPVSLVQHLQVLFVFRFRFVPIKCIYHVASNGAQLVPCAKEVLEVLHYITCASPEYENHIR